MTESTPADLAIAFRSLPRRLREASIGEVDPLDVNSTNATVNESIASAAHVLGCEATVEAIATTIERRRIADWSEGQLHTVQTIATTAGTAIRRLHDSADTGR
jgi:GAF domain-containing protein